MGWLPSLVEGEYGGGCKQLGGTAYQPQSQTPQASCRAIALHKALMWTLPPLVWTCRVSPPDPSVAWNLDSEISPVTFRGRSEVTSPLEAEASRLRLTVGSIRTLTSPPEVSISPPRALPRASAAFTSGNLRPSSWCLQPM